MNTKTLDLSLNRTAPSDSKKIKVSLSGVWMILETIVSATLALVMSIFFVWINGRQQEFDQLEDKLK
jgi:hypothetical protein